MTVLLLTPETNGYKFDFLLQNENMLMAGNVLLVDYCRVCYAVFWDSMSIVACWVATPWGHNYNRCFEVSQKEIRLAQR